MSETDPWSWREMSFAKWRTHVNDRFKNIYLVTLVDIGMDDEDLKSHWKDKEAPYEFVEWFALKYDLDPKSAIGL
jgi:hypothetical protein